jgi:hypothetical protein
MVPGNCISIQFPVDSLPLLTRSVWLVFTEDEREWYEERAAIIEHLGGHPRHWAELIATQLLHERRARQLGGGPTSGE